MQIQEKVKHTPGPWRKSPNKRWGYFWIKPGTDVRNNNLASVNSEANARLIAAAPELLEALNRCLDHLPGDTLVLQDVHREAEQAIAKAEGQA